MNRIGRVATTAFVIAFGLGACGSNSGLSAASRAQLTPLVERVRRAAESLDRRATQRSLVELQNAVADQVRKGDISRSRATEILSDVAGVNSRLALIPAPTTTTISTTTTTTSPPDTHGHGHDKKKHQDRANSGDGQN